VHRTADGGIGHNLPQEAPSVFVKAVEDVAGITANGREKVKSREVSR